MPISADLFFKLYHDLHVAPPMNQEARRQPSLPIPESAPAASEYRVQQSPAETVGECAADNSYPKLRFQTKSPAQPVMGLLHRAAARRAPDRSQLRALVPKS